MSNTVLLIHGAWLNARSWDAVKARYEARGFTVALLHGRLGTGRGSRSSKLAA